MHFKIVLIYDTMSLIDSQFYKTEKSFCRALEKSRCV